MKAKRWFGTLVLLTMIFSLSFSSSVAQVSLSVEPDVEEKIEAFLLSKLEVEGSADFIVRFTNQADLEAAKAMNWEARGEFVVQTLTEAATAQTKAIAYLNGRGLKHETFLAGNDLYVFQGSTVEAVALAKLAEVDSIRAARTYFITPYGSQLQSYDVPETAGQPAALAWGITYTKADQFWAGFGLKGEGIVVASIDTGVQWNHPALASAFKCGANPSDPACWSDPSNICGGSACDNNGHGTHVTGTMVGSDDPSLTWQAGMAPNSQWIACKGCESTSCSDYALNTCADWLLAPGGSAANRPNVVNNSWGGGGGDNWYLAKVNAWRAAGIFPAFSAGNSGPGCSTHGSPGDYQESFSSGAIDVSGTIAGFSSRGPSAFGYNPYTKPNIAAPGVNVCSSVPGNGWSCAYSGTSMASPHTAGAVALLWSCNADLVSEIDLTFQILQNTTNPTPAGNCGAPPNGEGNYTYGYGYLDILNAGMSYCGDVDLGTLSGHVYDDLGNPVEGANVSAAPAGRGAGIDAVTDPDGYYQMNLVVGTYTVTASKMNWTSHTVYGVEIFADSNTTQDFEITFLGSWLPGPTMCFDLTRFDAEFYPATGKVYILGGRSGDNTVGTIYAFDPEDDSCVNTGATMPVPISNYTTNLVNNGTDDVLCTFGGRAQAGNNVLNVQCYNPLTNTAATVANLPSAYSGYVPGAQAVVDNMVYVFGGFNPSASPYELTRTDRFDPLTNTFTQVGNLSLGRAYIHTAVVDGKIYAFGGTTFDGTNLNAQVRTEVMEDPGGAGTWNNAAVAELPVATAEGRAFGFDSDSLYYANQIILAGGGQWPGETADVFVYDIATDTYDYSFPNLIHARRNHASAFVPLTSENPMDGLPGMWVFGGRQGQDTPPYRPAEFYPLSVSEPGLEIDAWKDAPEFVEQGEVIRYAIFIEANELVNGMYMVDPLPAGVEYAGNLTWTEGEAWYDAGENTVYWEYGEPLLAAQQTVVYDPELVADLVGGVEMPGAPLPFGTVQTYAYPRAILWDNGPMITHPGGGYGGADASRLQTTLGMNTLGFGHQFINGYRMADDFEITDEQGWWIEAVTFFAYQTGALIDPSTMTGVYYQIWDGPPDDPGSSIVWGDLVTNRMVDSVWSNIYRDSESTPNVNNRPIMANTASAGVWLPPGVYWIEWMADGSLASGPWAPPVTIVGQITTGNALQYTTAWAPALDTGTSTQQDLPFIIEGTAGGFEPVLVEVSFDVTVTGVHGDIIVNEGWAGVFGGDEVIFAAVTEILGTPEMTVDPLELWTEVPVDSTAMQELNICNVGSAPLEWEIHEMPLLATTGSPFIPVGTTGKGSIPGLTPASPPASPANIPQATTLDVLWDQPLSAVNQNAYVNQEFSDAPDYSSFLADDFTNSEPWEITSFFVPGNGWNGFSTLFNASALTWQIYEDCAGVPCGNPSGGSPPVWTLTLPPADSQVVITSGTGGYLSNVQLNLDTPGILPPGTWWFVFYPTLDFGTGGQYGRQPADTTNGYYGQFINPGGGFGYGSNWQNWTIIGPTQQDIAFRIEGTTAVGDVPWLSEDPTSGVVPPGECQVVEVTFDATGMEPGDYFADLLINSNDPDTPQLVVSVTMTVVEVEYGLEVNWQDSELFGEPDETVTFEATLTNLGNVEDTFDLTFADNLWEVAIDPETITLAAGDSAQVSVMVTIPAEAEDGDWDEVIVTVVSQGDPEVWHEAMLKTTTVISPAASFTFEPNIPSVGQTVMFTNSTVGTEPIEYLWDFGDGETSTEEHPTHVYTEAGNYEVTLVATNAYGFDSYAVIIVVEDLPSEPNLTLVLSVEPSPILLGQPATFTALVSNIGDAAVHGVVASGEIPAHVTFVEASAACDFTDNVLTCDLGTIEPEESASAWVTVIFTATGPFTIGMEVGIPEYDPVSGTIDVLVETRLFLPLINRQ
jgi:uncharacterized repeat protein (TIGR01451 family)